MERNVIKYLETWKNDLDSGRGSRKPLIIRGARQVGKTHVVRDFAKAYFSQFINLNLERDDDRRLFKGVSDATTFIKVLELKAKHKIIPGQTLLFMDEIQQSEIALKQLRYLYEEMPNLHVLAAGSLLDVFIAKNKLETPVGRVEYCYMYPLTFDEFLKATGNQLILEQLSEPSLNDTFSTAEHEVFGKIFMEYALIGGMPEIVYNYISGETPQGLDRNYESLMTGYLDDIGKYASSAQSQYLRHCLENAPRSVGMQIAYNHFAESDFRSREISAAFDTLDLAQLVTRVFSSRSLALPLVQNRRKAPKLLFLDLGLVNYKLGQRENISSFATLENVYQGQLSEQIVGQALLALGDASQEKLAYWYRDKKGSNAEVDYLISFMGQLFPIEVKAGSSQKLHSLNVMIDELYKIPGATPPLALRVYSGKLTRTDLKTNHGNRYHLVSLPYYLLFNVRKLISKLV